MRNIERERLEYWRGGMDGVPACDRMNGCRDGSHAWACVLGVYRNGQAWARGATRRELVRSLRAWVAGYRAARREVARWRRLVARAGN